MLTARDKEGNIVFAERAVKGCAPEVFCPCCKKPMILRAGDVRRAHWAHQSAENCDEWWEEESEWRNKWIHYFSKLPDDDVETVVDVENVLEKNGIKHFYDVEIDMSIIVICRRKKIPASQLIERENFFGDMVWLVEASTSEYSEYLQFEHSRMRMEVEAPNKAYKMWHYLNIHLFHRWRDCQRTVVFDFEAASNGEKTNLLCMLPGRRIDGSEFLECPRNSLVRCLQDNTHLLMKGRNDISEQIDEARDDPQDEQEEPDLASEVNSPQRIIVAPQLPKSLNEEVLTLRKEELVSEYRRLGFSEGDANARANLKLEQERD